MFSIDQIFNSLVLFFLALMLNHLRDLMKSE